MASADIPPEQGSLERLGVAIETEIPEDILKPSVIRALRFRQQAKLGYYTKDVEAFVQQQALTSIEWYIQRLHARDLDVHRLGEELDRLEVDMMNVRAQFEMAAASAPIAAAIAQAEQDPEVEAIVARARQDQADLAAAYERIEALEEDLAAAGSSVPVQDVAIETRIAELEGQLEAAEEERDQFALLVQQAQEEVAPEVEGNANEQVAELEEYAQQQDEYIDLLLNRIDELEAELDAADQNPAALSEEVESDAEAPELPAESIEIEVEELELPADTFEAEAAAEAEADTDEYYAQDYVEAEAAGNDYALDDEELAEVGVIAQESEAVQYEEEPEPDDDEPYQAPMSEAPDRNEGSSGPRFVEVNGRLIELPEGLSPEDFE